ncbi:MAG: TonB-dependent receptor plug domain-containing protein [Sphingobacterium sp.]|uniref:TonB-dependent receptor plug domain-containing protein n=1 Tax=Sphingobacterium sp. JB170 TaxID=1434842 RepID=UPI00097EDBE9|nr:TonB-dependent receptor [Sphingobacterium sp. JB170]SJN49442.1 Outer membrane vitamin B12 receptor BtuB [Sphingobacterium sp. JB170]
MQFKTISLLVLFPLLSQAQDTTNIREVIVNQNRLQIPFHQDNRNIEIITAEQISRLPVKNINEVLGLLNGVDLRQRGPLGAQADISIDGGSFDQTLVLINGAKVSDPQTGHLSLNLPVPLDAIERIEVLRGAAARIYGANALTGAVNIITRRVDGTSVQANVYTGSSFKEREEEGKSGIYHHIGSQIGMSWQGERQQHQVFYNKEKTNGQRYNTAAEIDKIFYQGQTTLNPANQIEWMGAYIYNDFGANGFYASPGDKNSREIVETIFTSISSNHQLNDRLYISPRISNRYNEDDYRYNDADISTGRSIHFNNSFATELNARYTTDFGDFGLGLESRFEKITSSNMGRYDRDNYGAYTEFTTDKIANLTVNLGAYLNYNSQFGWQLYPGFDLGYNVNNQWKIIVNAGSSQRIPTFTDLYLQQTGNIGNPMLMSENAWQIEGALKFENEHITAHAGYFYRDIDDFIDWLRTSEQEPFQPFNMGQNKVNGINTNFSYTLRAPEVYYSATLGYSYLDPALKTDDGFISKYALENLKHQAKLLLTANSASWNIALANRFNQRISHNSYFLNDIRLGYNFPALTAYADVQNLFDVTYVESGAIPMPGRWYSVGVKYRWHQQKSH